MTRLQKLPFHPAFFALYPVLALLANNLNEVDLRVGLRPLLLALAGALLLLLLFWWFTRDISRSALASSLVLALFFSYGQVYAYFKHIPALASVLGRHRTLTVLYLAVLAVGLWYVLRRLKHAAGSVAILNFVGLVLVILPVGQIVFAEIRTAQQPAIASAQTSGGLKMDPAKTPPDVYYIILDMYARQDVLTEQFDYDNSPFVNQLRSMGFYVADCSHSNYLQTEYSLSSSLNLNYLQDLKAERSALPSLMKQSLVRKQLESLGYRSAAFETGYYWDQWQDADFYFAPTSQSSMALRQLSPFEAMLVRSTAVVSLVDGYSRWFSGLSATINMPYAEHIQRQRYVLDKLNTIPSVAGPKLVFAHILIPHYPFVFSANGDILTDPGYFADREVPINATYFRKGYVGQVEYINARLVPILQNILRNSTTPPIIIVQGDHGVDGINRAANLSAYYFPDQNYSALYPDVSPVNTFRVVFNQYFGTQYPLLDDISYSQDGEEERLNFSIFAKPTNRCK